MNANPRTVPLGLRPKPRFINGYSNQRYYDTDASFETNGPGFGIFFDAYQHDQKEFYQDGYWKHSKKPKILKKVVNTYQMFNMSIITWNKVFNITVRLWKIKNANE